MIMVAPKLKRVTVLETFGLLDANNDTEAVFFADGRPGRTLLDTFGLPGFESNITSLEFNKANIHPKVFHWLLGHSKMLKRFKYTVMGFERLVATHTPRAANSMPAPREAQQTLEVLHPDAGSRGYHPDPDEDPRSPAPQWESFEEVPKLRKVTVNFYMIVPLKAACVPGGRPDGNRVPAAESRVLRLLGWCGRDD